MSINLFGAKMYQSPSFLIFYRRFFIKNWCVNDLITLNSTRQQNRRLRPGRRLRRRLRPLLRQMTLACLQHLSFSYMP